MELKDQYSNLYINVSTTIGIISFKANQLNIRNKNIG